MIVTFEQKENEWRLEIGDLVLQVTPVAGASLGQLRPAGTLVWIGSTFFVERPQTITPMRGNELEGRAQGIVWTHQAGRTLWELLAWGDETGDLFQRWQEILPLRLLTVPQVAQRLGIHRTLVARYCRMGRLSGALKIEGHGWLIPEVGLELYERERKGAQHRDGLVPSLGRAITHN